jgi:hypothetical protein
VKPISYGILVIILLLVVRFLYTGIRDKTSRGANTDFYK